MNCAYCATQFMPKYPNQKCCNERHGDLFYKATKGNRIKREKRAIEKANKGPFYCKYCGYEFIPVPHTRLPGYCNKEHKRLYEHRLRRALRFDAFISAYSRLKIFERDSYECHLCKEPLNMSVVVPAWDAPTIDHIIPLSKGGNDDEGNVKSAHYRCNNKKSNKILAMGGPQNV